jgi:hypothetical protein
MDTARLKKIAIRVVAAVIVLGVVGPLLYTYAALSYSYSNGERIGFVQKLSSRGWLCKTNEGELSMVNMPGQPAEKFTFTVRDDKLVKQIDELAGHKVALTYAEHRGVPLSCFGDTQYFIVGVRKAE